MVAMKLLTLIFILIIIVCSEMVEAGTKKHLRNIKRKKAAQNGKLKANLKQQAPASKPNQRNGKMNYYTSHLWPTTTTYYRPATPSVYRRSPSTSPSSMLYPLHWGHSYISPSSFMSTNTLRRTEDISSSPLATDQPSVMSMASLNNPIISMSNSHIPTLYDMSAFTGNVGLMEHPLTSTNSNFWSVGETVVSTPKPKLNMFNNFNYNDDDLFGGFLNQFLK